MVHVLDKTSPTFCAWMRPVRKPGRVAHLWMKGLPRIGFDAVMTCKVPIFVSSITKS